MSDQGTSGVSVTSTSTNSSCEFPVANMAWATPLAATASRSTAGRPVRRVPGQTAESRWTLTSISSTVRLVGLGHGRTVGEAWCIVAERDAARATPLPTDAAPPTRAAACGQGIVAPMGAKITLVGGGSTHWTPKLTVDFANTPALADAELVLYDLDPDSLPPALKVVEHVAERRGIPLTARATTDIDDALGGAEYVIATFSVGGFASMRHDIEIPSGYGIRQTVGDSVGPGGISRALRSVPVILAVARAMERCCPEALLVNVSNPLTALCRAVTRETSIKTVGLCAEIVGLKFVLSLLFDADFTSVDPVVAGVNHLPLVTSLRIGDGDGFEMLRGALAGDVDLSGPTLDGASGRDALQDGRPRTGMVEGRHPGQQQGQVRALRTVRRPPRDPRTPMWSSSFPGS